MARSPLMSFSNDERFWDGVLDVCAGIAVTTALARGANIRHSQAESLRAKAERADWVLETVYSQWFQVDPSAQRLLIIGLVKRFKERAGEFGNIHDDVLQCIASIYIANYIVTPEAPSVAIRWLIEMAGDDPVYERLWSHYLHSGL